MCSLHLGAREDQHHEKRRRQHYRELTETLKNIEDFKKSGWNDWNSFMDKIGKSYKAKDFIYLGDFNLHNVGETGMIYENKMQDIHLDTNGANDKGYTWDSKHNVLIRLILPCDNRRMRLDRITVGQEADNLRFDLSYMFADKKINFSRMCRRYHASDHFGLACRFEYNSDVVLSQKFDYEANKEKVWDGVDPKTTGFRPFKKIIRYRIMWLSFLGLILLSGLVLGGFLGVKGLIWMFTKK